MPRAAGAYGTLTVTHDITRYTRAKVFSRDRQADGSCSLRFSTVAGERGAADAERDVRGFALKFYTEEGNWDIVGNNTPVFFVRDPLKFPDFIHTQKRHPRTNLRSPTAMWDFWSLAAGEPAPGHDPVLAIAACRRATAIMHGFGSHTYSLHQRGGRALLGQVPLQDPAGHQDLRRTARREAVVAKDRESAQRDLYEAIEGGEFPRWKLLRAGHARDRCGEAPPTTRSTSPRCGRTRTIR